MSNILSVDRLSSLSELISRRMGLQFKENRWNDLERNIAQAAKEFKFKDPEEFIDKLFASELNSGQMEILASCLTVSETYFWREPKVFETLVKKILPEIARQKEKSEKRLRIWSAGCSSGEEPYSIAIALHRALPDIKEWNITILATDINPAILRKAAAGIYGEWSFREPPSWLLSGYFSEKSDKKYRLNEEIRKMVKFAYLNLVEDVYPSPVNNTNAMDIIFCRNVLMYFVPEKSRQAVKALRNSLVENGLFFTSACELSQELFAEFSSISFAGVLVYRKDNTRVYMPMDSGMEPKQKTSTVFESLEPKIPAEAETSPAISEKIASALEFLAKGQYAGTVKKLEETPKAPAALAIRALANEGKLTEALVFCEETLKKEKFDPVVYYLKAIILQELNREGEAIISLKKALYIDRNMILAHFTLGNILLRQGGLQPAKKSFKNALSLLEAGKQEEIVPESDGLTAGRFKEIINATMLSGAGV